MITAIISIASIYSCNSSSSSEKKSNCSSSEAEEFMVRKMEAKGWTIGSVNCTVKDETNCDFIFRVDIAGLGCKNVEIKKTSGNYEFADLQDCR